MNNRRIQIIEKPDWVSWDDIHQVIWKAHEQNREKGIQMRIPTLTGEELCKFIGGNGKMFVALDGEKVVGVLALVVKEGKQWYNRGRYGYVSLGAVLSEYSGRGVFRALYDNMETEARRLQLSVLVRRTHENNERILKISKQQGYHFVGYKTSGGYFHIVRVKWLDGCPYPLWYINLRFHLSKLFVKSRYKIVPGKSCVKRFGI